MQDERAIQEEIELVNTLKMLTQAYEEISVLRMQRVKGSVLLTRDFLTRLANVFNDVKSNYRSEILRRFGKETEGKLSFSTVARNGKSVSVLLTANARLYGDIVRRVYNLFIKDIRKRETDIVIVGTLGKEFFEAEMAGVPYTYYQLPDRAVSSDDLVNLTTAMVNYENVYIYYGQFLNVVTQKPSVANIAGQQTFEGEGDRAVTSEKKFFFEPSLERILYFFETQVFSSLIKQTTHEGELSRLASRVRAMEEAISNIEEKEDVLNQEYRRVRRRKLGKRQLDILSGMYLWNA